MSDTHDQWSKADEAEALDALRKAGLPDDEAARSLSTVMSLATNLMLTPVEAADKFAMARASFMLRCRHV